MSNSNKSDDPLPSEAIKHYVASGYEAKRLENDVGKLEFARTKKILKDVLPRPPAVIFDVGGGPGIYACWLAQEGYEVHLIDAVPLHVEMAENASARQLDTPITSVAIGDARSIPHPDNIADIVLLFGPLYHLTQRGDRLAALREARRITKSGGLILSVAISKFTSALDGLVRGFFQDPAFVQIVRQDLQNGQHRNPSNNPFYFTTAYFHHPNELKAEIQEAGLQHERLLSVEGPGWMLQDFEDHWTDEARRNRLLSILGALEEEPSMLGASAHIMAIARKLA